MAGAEKENAGENASESDASSSAASASNAEGAQAPASAGQANDQPGANARIPAKPTKRQRFAGLRRHLHRLYFGRDRQAQNFRYALLAFDIITILYFAMSSTMTPVPWIFWVDYAIGTALTVELIASLMARKHPWRGMREFTTMTDVIVIASLFASALVQNLAFLRVVRMLRLLRSYHLLRGARERSLWFRRNENVFESSINLFVFIYVITAIVYVLEEPRNDAINNFFDALYFTVTTLTTTGFGDITMDGTGGRILAVVIMVFGVALFLRLVQTIFRPPKIFYICPDCGLNRHDPDAVHCKHCGDTINIPTEGSWT